MHGMKIRNIFIALLGAVFILPSYGLIEELDLYAWQEDEPLPRGWSSDKLKKAAEGKEMYGGAYFDAKAGWLRSPVFDSTIRSVTIYVSTSMPDPTRFMYLKPMCGGAAVSERIPVAKTPTRAYMAQTFELDGFAADQFELDIDGSGSNGSWAVIYIIVRYGRPEAGEDDGKPSDSWALSSFVPKPGIRCADFSPLGEVIPGASSNLWQNGETVKGFHAFFGDEPCASIRNGGPASTAGGLYAIITNDVRGSLRALALHGTGERTASLVLPIALDADRRLEQMSVSYRIWELGKEGRSASLSFACCTADDLETMDATGVSWVVLESAAWKSGDTNEVRAVGLPVGSFRAARYVCLRWQVPRQTNSSIIGISDVCVATESRPSGFKVLIR